MALLRTFVRRLLSDQPESVHDYLGVVVPLEEAHLHSHSARIGRCEFEERPGHEDDDGDDEDGKDQGESTGMLEMSAAEYTIEGLRKEVRRGGRGMWTEYELKSKLVNKAIQDIGMGRYNWQLFILCGFGWFADNLWMHGVSLTLPSLSAEFAISEKTVRYTTSSIFLGLCFGSFVWGIGSDVLGRRIAFNMTLLITGVFGILLAFAPSWGWVCFLFASLGFGVGGNLPVDGALFLEFLPDASSSLLTLLSVWWPVGQLSSSLAAWYFIVNWPADQGWRRFVLTIGLVTFIMFVVRFFAFRLFESPKFLLSKGRQAEAVAVVHGIAYRNGAKTWLTEEILDAVVEGVATDDDDGTTASRRGRTAGVLKDKMKSFSADRLRPLFKTRTLGLATAIVWFVWATIGMGYPLFNAFLPQYLSHGGAAPPEGSPDAGATPITPATYRTYAITSAVGVPGSLLAAYLVDQKSPWLGRRGTLACSTFVSAVFLFMFVKFGTSPASQLFFSCVESFSQNIMYGVLYAFTPEIFPAPVRGAGTGVASFLNRAMGLMAPVLAANMPGDGTTTPIYLSGALILAAFVGMCAIPIETRGRQRL
ncbi:putative MFS-type transporter PB1E7.08c [Colletotrichum gloeosporioides]|uniref:Putative MFS-type transporter PB1E7.08c n=1 Tax=Colletotrichum gloeosporioides TaxID=474922 RepID=A0A8H4CSN0_COLGL|nr:putative MFS-type transporter PB1E7.08c [Colletotrichum gloeosporioides]KAF3809395.1 putative MFS-type transporter PB1E7.08c [Colletotrichum gloeosporioides]